MNIIYLFLTLLIFLSIFMIRSNNNLKLIIYFSTFSLISASLYYFLKAPDLALAEAAIGSAIIPLIYLIAISKQREFLVVSHISEDDHFLSDDGACYHFLNEFTKLYHLKLVVKHGNDEDLQGMFRSQNVDLVIEKDIDSDHYLLKGKKTSILMNKLEQLTKDEDNIKVIKIEEGEMDD